MAAPIALASSFTPLLMPVLFPDVEQITFKQFYQQVVVDTDTCINWLQINGLLARGMLCKCGLIMRSRKFSTIIEELGWRCPERNCRKFASLRIEYFLEGSNLPLLELLEFVFLWAKDIQSIEALVENLGWATATITDWTITDFSSLTSVLSGISQILNHRLTRRSCINR